MLLAGSTRTRTLVQKKQFPALPQSPHFPQPRALLSKAHPQPSFLSGPPFPAASQARPSPVLPQPAFPEPPAQPFSQTLQAQVAFFLFPDPPGSSRTSNPNPVPPRTAACPHAPRPPSLGLSISRSAPNGNPSTRKLSLARTKPPPSRPRCPHPSAFKKQAFAQATRPLRKFSTSAKPQPKPP